MIIYFDGPNINFVNSIIEYDLIKKLSPECTLNLLTSDKKTDFEEKLKQYDNSHKKKTNVNNIQRELINLLSYDFDPFFVGLDKSENEEEGKEKEREKEKEKEREKEKEKENELTNNSNNKVPITKYNDSTNSSINDMRFINNPLFNNGINNNLHNMNNQINVKTNFSNRINLNDNMGDNIIYNFDNTINNMYNNPINYNINNNIPNKFINPYFYFTDNSNPIIINNYINNHNNNQINNQNSNYINYNNSFVNNNNIFKDNSNISSQNRSNNNFQNTYIINDYDNINNINEMNVNNFQMYKVNNMNAVNNIKNINYFNNINNNMNIYKNDKSKNVKESKYSNMSLMEIISKLEVMAKKQQGCRFLENLINTNENSREIINNIFYPKLYWTKLLQLCIDLFGNYFVQTMIPKLNYQNLVSFTNLVNENLLKLSLNAYGTRVVQALIENIKDNKYNLLTTFTSFLSKIMNKLINDLNGSFVLMHYAEEVKDNEIIYNFLNNNILEICRKTYSCSALQKFIDIGSNMQKIKLINNIVNNTNNIIGSQCGLYVFQFIMNKKNYQINDLILQKIIKNVIKLSKQKYSSNVIEKCLETCSPESVNKLIEIFNNDIVISDLIKDIFGNYVIQKLLIVCTNDKIKSHILTIIASEFSSLSNISFGPKLIKKLTINYPEIKSKL